MRRGCCMKAFKYICTHSRCRAHHCVHNRRKDVYCDNCLSACKETCSEDGFTLPDTPAHPPTGHRTHKHPHQYKTVNESPAISEVIYRLTLCYYGAEMQTAAVAARVRCLSCKYYVILLIPTKKLIFSLALPLNSPQGGQRSG